MAIKVAAIQAAPAYLNLDESIKKAVSLTHEAAQHGARLVVFPETWLPGYPAWLDCCRDAAIWDHEPVKKIFGRLVENSVLVPGPATNALAAAARELEVVIVLGINERVAVGPGRGTLYNSLLTFDTKGEIANKHRKIMPTYSERMIWGAGDGASLQAINTTVGRIGGLICWEHWMPPARQVLHESSEDIHIAAWPQVKEMNLVASRHYAFEGRCFVIASGAIMRAYDLPRELEPAASLRLTEESLVLRGGSAIIGPDGRLIAGPVLDEETIVYADIDLAQISEEHLTLDVTGHYSRPDIFECRLKV